MNSMEHQIYKLVMEGWHPDLMNIHFANVDFYKQKELFFMLVLSMQC